MIKKKKILKNQQIDATHINIAENNNDQKKSNTPKIIIVILIFCLILSQMIWKAIKHNLKRASTKDNKNEGEGNGDHNNSGNITSENSKSGKGANNSGNGNKNTSEGNGDDKNNGNNINSEHSESGDDDDLSGNRSSSKNTNIKIKNKNHIMSHISSTSSEKKGEGNGDHNNSGNINSEHSESGDDDESNGNGDNSEDIDKYSHKDTGEGDAAENKDYILQNISSQSDTDQYHNNKQADDVTSNFHINQNQHLQPKTSNQHLKYSKENHNSKKTKVKKVKTKSYLKDKKTLHLSSNTPEESCDKQPIINHIHELIDMLDGDKIPSIVLNTDNVVNIKDIAFYIPQDASEIQEYIETVFDKLVKAVRKYVIKNPEKTKWNINDILEQQKINGFLRKLINNSTTKTDKMNKYIMLPHMEITIPDTEYLSNTCDDEDNKQYTNQMADFITRHIIRIAFDNISKIQANTIPWLKNGDNNSLPTIDNIHKSINNIEKQLCKNNNQYVQEGKKDIYQIKNTNITINLNNDNIENLTQDENKDNNTCTIYEYPGTVTNVDIERRNGFAGVLEKKLSIEQNGEDIEDKYNATNQMLLSEYLLDERGNKTTHNDSLFMGYVLKDNNQTQNELLQIVAGENFVDMKRSKFAQKLSQLLKYKWLRICTMNNFYTNTHFQYTVLSGGIYAGNLRAEKLEIQNIIIPILLTLQKKKNNNSFCFAVFDSSNTTDRYFEDKAK